MKRKIIGSDAGMMTEKGSSGLTIKKVGLCSIMIALAAIITGSFGVKNSLDDQGDTAATSDEMISVGDFMTINPDYEDYINDVENGRGSEWNLVPNKFVPVRTRGSNSMMFGAGNNESLPSTYNLRDAGYATTIKNQGSDDNCWAYTTTSVMESYLLRNKGVTVEYAPKQLDYLMAKDTPYGRFVYENYGNSREIGDGWSFNAAGLGLTASVAVPTSETNFFAKMKANDSTLSRYNSWREYEDEQTIFRIFGITTSHYTKPISYSALIADRSNYLLTEYVDYRANNNIVDTVKSYLYNNGAVFAGTVSPKLDGCWDASTKTIVDRGSALCSAKAGHAMTVIGWDDGHTYTDPGSGETKTGAFILQNSWGTSNLIQRYGINYDTAVSYGLIDESELTAEQIEALKSRVNESLANYDAYETIYLGYDYAADSFGDFGLIKTMQPNDFDAIHSAILADGYQGSQSGATGNEKVYVYSTGTETEYIDSVAVGNYLVVSAADFNYDIAIDAGSGYKDVASGVIEKNSIGVQKMVKLATPMKVKGTYKVKVSLYYNGNALSYGEYEDYFTNTVYMKTPANASDDEPSGDGGNNSGESSEQNTEDDKAEDRQSTTDEEEDDIVVPNTSAATVKTPDTGGNTGIDMGGVIGVIIALPIIPLVMGLGLHSQCSVNKHRKFD